MRGALIVLLAGCGTAPVAPAEPEPERGRAPVPEPDEVIDRAAAALRRGDLATAKAVLERDHWLARDRARAALLLFGCLVIEGEYARGIEVLREYLSKTTRLKTARDGTVQLLLRHHASGGGKRPTTAEEACYFGLYALKALDEEDTARPHLERALAEAPEPERSLVRIAWQP